MGRQRKQLSEQVGNLTKEMQVRRETEQALVKTDNDYLLRPPTWLKDKVAKAEYKRLVKELAKIDMLGNLDANNLAGYCNAFSKYLQASGELQDGKLIISTENGAKENPLVAVQIKYAKEMRDFARLCGLTIDSRLKFAAVKLDQTEDKINDEFGDI